MNGKTQQMQFVLNEKSVDDISAQIEQFLFQLHLSTVEAARVRLSMEEALLRWMDHFEQGADVTLSLRSRFGRPQIMLQVRGERYNPLVHVENESGEWMQSLFTSGGCMPAYFYRQGVNVVQLKLQKQRRNPILALLIALAVGTAVGLLGRLALPTAVMDSILRLFLSPAQSAVFRTLNAVSGPVIFLSVLTAVCGVGSVSVMSSSGKRMIGHFLCICILVTTIGAAISIPAFQLTPRLTAPDGMDVSGGLSFILELIPSDVLNPLAQGNSPQIVLSALVFGCALLVIGTRAESLMAVLRQANDVALVVADWIGGLAPYFICILLILGIWNGSIRILIGVWKPLLLFVVIAALALFGSLLRVSISKKVPLRMLLQKMLPSFRKALRTSSVDAAYAENLRCCTQELGIHSSLTDYGLPLGLVIYMPAGSVAALIVTMYAAKSCAVPVTLMWLITAILLTTILVMASPPVTGVGLLAYAAIFAHLGIPNDALTMALIADILFSFLIAAMNQAMLQAELILEADRMHQLDFQKLRNVSEN